MASNEAITKLVELSWTMSEINECNLSPDLMVVFEERIGTPKHTAFHGLTLLQAWESLRSGIAGYSAHITVDGIKHIFSCLKQTGEYTDKESGVGIFIDDPRFTQLLGSTQGDYDLGQQAHHLVYGSPPSDTWEGCAFRSEQEVRIAKALDDRGVLFFPNAGCRITEGDIRKTREADFLVIIEGRIGILECDGKAYHQTAAEDHQRDRHFQRQGIQFIQRYSYEECLQEYRVVDDFLALMRKFFNL